MATFFFYYQVEGKESKWTEALADRRETVIRDLQPAFSTVLDLTAAPDDNDWSKVKYRGPLYFDFDADGDLPFVCQQFRTFLGKLDSELDFDITQARFFASGSKGFHVEIPQECFLPKIPKEGIAWLPYIYREIAQALILDSMDLAVYTGKKGRQWRTVNVQRENGRYKIPLTIEEALSIDEDAYVSLISEPRPLPCVTPPHCNAKFALLFDKSREKVTATVRGKKKRMEKANAILDPYKRAKKTPPTLKRLMEGEDLAEGAGFQLIAMQLAIYATSVGMSQKDFLAACDGLCERHVSDSYRYNTKAKRKSELSRMFQYMEDNSLYDFDVGPIVRLLKPGTTAPDLGFIEEARPEPKKTEDGEGGEEIVDDVMKGVRKGFFVTENGMFRRTAEGSEPICRAHLANVESFFDVEKREFAGFEFDVVVGQKKLARKMLGSDSFTSVQAMKKFFGSIPVSFQGTESDTAGLLDWMTEKTRGKTYVYPREGLGLIQHPNKDEKCLVPIYLTQDEFQSSINQKDPDYFLLKYRPTMAVSTYQVDIHKAPELNPEMEQYIPHLLNFNHASVVANTLGWFLAAHYRSPFLHVGKQFPMLQVYGEAGSGKTQTVLMLSRLHWYLHEPGLNSALSFTPFTLDSKVNSSNSAPCIIDEYKPRELRAKRGAYEKLKDVMKASYVGGDVGDRGTINKQGESHLSVIKAKAAAPIVFMAEAIESETAVFERCISVRMVQDYQTPERTRSFMILQKDEGAKDFLSAIGREITEAGFGLNLDTFRKELEGAIEAIKAKLPSHDDPESKRMAERLIYNKAVVVLGIRMLKRALNTVWGTKYDAAVEDLIADHVSNIENSEEAKATKTFGMSEIGKVISRIALLSRANEKPYELLLGKDYIVEAGWVEFKVERAYDCYRQYCASINDQPLFDNLEAFKVALFAYSPCVDSFCAASALREDSSSESIVRLDTRKLNKQGVQLFRN